jgi:hypothetical protein
LPFIDYALQEKPSEKTRNSVLIGEGPVLGLRFVSAEDDDDDDAQGDMMRTAVNLLLSLFEGAQRLPRMNQTLLIVFHYSQSAVQTFPCHNADCGNRRTTWQADSSQVSNTPSSRSRSSVGFDCATGRRIVSGEQY